MAVDVDNAVRAIIADVRSGRDAALFELTLKFDRLDLRRTGLTITAAEIDAAFAACSKETIEALELARDRIADHHQRQVPSDDRYRDAAGVELGHRWTAVELVGLYVPGGLASYPSSVLMNAVPAKVAGVPRIAMVVPSPAANSIRSCLRQPKSPGWLKSIASVARRRSRLWPTAPRLFARCQDRRSGQRLCCGREASGVRCCRHRLRLLDHREVLVIADSDNDPEWIASDLLAQAEHDTAAQSILMTDDDGFARTSSAQSDDS